MVPKDISSCCIAKVCRCIVIESRQGSPRALSASPNRFKMLKGILLLLSTPAEVVRINLFTDFGVASIRFRMAM